MVNLVGWAPTLTASYAPAFSSSIYGGVAGGLTDEADGFIRSILGSLLDTQQSLPPC